MKNIILTICLAAMSVGAAQTNTNSLLEFYGHMTNDFFFPLYQVTVGNNGGATNIIIATNYTGTIQIGTNFYTRKDFDDLAVIKQKLKH